MRFQDLTYICFPPLSGVLSQDVPALLEANGRPKTAVHVRQVAEACARLAGRFGLDEIRCRDAGLLHDAGAVVRPQDMLLSAERAGWPLCGAERKYPFLLHQRVSRVLAEERFGVADEGILSAVECHTTLKPHASPLDMALFLADKIAWDQPGQPPYLDALRAGLDRSLAAGCYFYMTWMGDNGRVLCPHDQWTAALSWLAESLREDLL